jgi:hypothetical protein
MDRLRRSRRIVRRARSLTFRSRDLGPARQSPAGSGRRIQRLAGPEKHASKKLTARPCGPLQSVVVYASLRSRALRGVSVIRTSPSGGVHAVPGSCC